MDLDRDVVRALARARSLSVLTGAGISAESGLATFRGAGGWWRDLDPMTLATPDAFARDPKLVWEFYEFRRERAADARPNAGHATLVEMEAAFRTFTLVTQNVDGLHQRAGSQNVIALHGDLWTVRCVACGESRVDRTVPLPELPPRCRCGGMLRPGVVWFDEPLAPGVMGAAADAVIASDVLLVVGTSCVVYPAAGLVPSALRAHIRVIEVNIERAADHPGVVSICGKSGEVLPALWRAVREQREAASR